MARNDGVDRTVALNRAMDAGDVIRAQGHNERQNESYGNFDVVLDRTPMNVHFKAPTGDYTDMFDRMVADGIISTRGLKSDATHFCELLLDVNTAYFGNHGGYEFAKQFYADAYKAAVDIVGGEQYILSAVMHADERNRPMSESLGRDVYHYHLHVVYVPVVEKQVLWSKRCKDPALVGTVKETIMQVSRSKKWASAPVLDDQGQPMKTSTGKPILKKSYSVLQDDFFHAMRAAGYTDVERGERGSTEEHLSVTQFKVQQEQQRLMEIQAKQEAVLAATAEATQAREQAEEGLSETLAKLDEMAPLTEKLEAHIKRYADDPEKLLPAAGVLEAGKAYREQKALPVMEKLFNLIRSLLRKVATLTQEKQSWQTRYDHDVGFWKDRASQWQQTAQQDHSKARKFDRAESIIGKEQMQLLLVQPIPMPTKRKENHYEQNI